MSEETLKQWSVSKRPPNLESFLGPPDLKTRVAKIIKERKNHAILISGPTGCLPADSEFLTPNGWKRMDCYEHEDLVAVYDKDSGKASFEEVEYVKLKCKKPFHVFDSGSLIMELSGEHRVLYDDYRGVRKVATADECAERPSRRIIPTTFSINTDELDISDVDIRLRIAFSADGSGGGTNSKSYFNFHKGRKKNRLSRLLNRSRVPYSVSHSSSRKTATTFSVSTQKGWTKTLDWIWKLSRRQLAVVIEECVLWDGTLCNNERVYFTTIKKNADAIQYAAHAIGLRATIKRKTYPDNPNWKDGFCVHIRTSDNSKNRASIRESTSIRKRRSPDGYKYCFTTSTGFFIARCKDTIFVTGNCGKTTLAKIIAYGMARVPYGTRCPDIQETNIGVSGNKDDIIRLVESSKFLPSKKDGRRVFILDECQKFSGAAADAILRPLEEPAPHVTWILCTNEPERLKPVLVGRCYPLKVDLANETELANMLLRVLREEEELRDWSSADRKKLVRAVVQASGQIPRVSLQILAAAVDAQTDYKDVNSLIAGSIMSAPGVMLEQAVNKILIGLLIRYELGKNVRKPIFSAAIEHDAYALLRRLSTVSNLLFLESTVGKSQPGTYMFNKDAAAVLPEHGIQRVSVEAIGIIQSRLVNALLSLKDFSVDPKLVLIDALNKLHVELKA